MKTWPPVSLRHLPQVAFASAAEHPPLHVKPPVDVIDAVNDGVRFLGRFDAVLPVVGAALIVAVGDQDQRFSANFALQLFVRRQIDGVEQQRAFWRPVCGTGPCVRNRAMPIIGVWPSPRKSFIAAVSSRGELV